MIGRKSAPSWHSRPYPSSLWRLARSWIRGSIKRGNDPAAAVDADRDGFPDAWNEGQTPADSTTGLTLDAYPSDSACHDLDQGNGVVCNIAAALPRYAPDDIAIDDTGIVYLLNGASQRVYRYDSRAAAPLNPLVIGSASPFDAQSPSRLTYSAAQARLYLGYDGGAITFIDSNDAQHRERDWLATRRPLDGLLAIGNFVFARDDGGPVGTHYIWDAEGTLRASVDWRDSSPAYSYDSVRGRLYYIDRLAAGSLAFESIDPSSGTLGTQGSSFDFDFQSTGPIRVSRDGNTVVLGSGRAYEAATMQAVAAVPDPFTDAVWLEDGRLLTVRPTLSYSGEQGNIAQYGTQLDVLDAGRAVVHTENFAGAPLRVLDNGSRAIVVTEDGPSFEPFDY